MSYINSQFAKYEGQFVQSINMSHFCGKHNTHRVSDSHALTIYVSDKSI